MKKINMNKKKNNSKLKNRMKMASLMKEQLKNNSSTTTYKSHPKKRKSKGNSLLKYKTSMVSLII